MAFYIGLKCVFWLARNGVFSILPTSVGEGDGEVVEESSVFCYEDMGWGADTP